MKKTLETQDQVRNLARGIQQRLLDLEAEHQKTEQVYSELLENAAEMVNIGRSAPMYVRERANRLRALLDALRDDFSGSRRRHARLYHQIERLDDALVSAVLSPALERERGSGTEPANAGGDSLLIYELGGMRFAAPGRILERRQAPDRSREPEYEGAEINVFPHPGSAFMPRESDSDLLIMKFMGRVFALWADAVIGSQSSELIRNLESLHTRHRFIKGRANLGGRPVYIIDPS